MIKSIGIAWAAGIYEGEGTVRTVTNKRNNVAPAFPTVVVYQQDRWILDRLQELFGGTVTWYTRVHHWRLSGPAALAFMQTIFVFLSPWRQRQFLDEMAKARKTI